MPYNPQVSTRLDGEDFLRFIASTEPRDLGYKTLCNYWAKGKFREGYGAFAIDGKTYRAHRVIWADENGRWPEETLDHLCHDPATCSGGWECPHRACVNPDHLAPKSIKENVLRGGGPTAANAKKTVSINGNPLDKVDPRTGWRSSSVDRAAAAARRLERDRDKINARRREIREHIIHDPRPCEVCGTMFTPIRVGSGRGRLCPKPPKTDTVAYSMWLNCANERQRLNRNKRLGKDMP